MEGLDHYRSGFYPEDYSSSRIRLENSSFCPSMAITSCMSPTARARRYPDVYGYPGPDVCEAIEQNTRRGGSGGGSGYRDKRWVSTLEKSRQKLDRLFAVKRNIMESLNMLNKQAQNASDFKTRKEGSINSLTRSECPGAGNYATHIDVYKTKNYPYRSNGVYTEKLSSNTGERMTCQRAFSGNHETEQDFEKINRTWPREVSNIQYHVSKYEVQDSLQRTPEERRILTVTDTQEPEFYRCSKIVPLQRVETFHTNQERCEVSSQELPETEEDEVNGDIRRYLNQFDEQMTWAMSHGTEYACRDFNAPHSEYSNRYSQYREEAGRGRERYNEQRCALPTDDDGHSDPLYDRVTTTSFYPDTTTLCSNSQYSNEYKNISHIQKSNIQVSSHPESRMSSDNNLSGVSFETDSDFVFFPTISLAQRVQRVSLNDSPAISQVSPIHGNLDRERTSLTWRSDFLGSSLDDVTKQFFLDEDALSDDVFVDEREGESAKPKFVTDFSQTTFEKSFQTDYTVSTIVSEQMFSDKRLSSSERQKDVAIRKSAIRRHDKCLQVNLDDEDVPTDFDLSEMKDSASTVCVYDLSHTFDSLRKNNMQSKSRQLWRNRRAKGNKIDQSTASPTFQKTSRGQERLFFSFDSPNPSERVGIPRTSPTPPAKPLRGILKNKDCSSPVAARGLKSGLDKPVPNNTTGDNATFDTVVISEIPLPVSPVVWYDAIDPKHESKSEDTTCSSVKSKEDPSIDQVPIVREKTVMENVIQLSTDATEFGAESASFHLVTKNEKNKSPLDPLPNEVRKFSPMLTENRQSTTDSGDIERRVDGLTQKSSEDFPDCSNLLNEVLSEEDGYHYLKTSTEDGAGEVIAIRKNSLEVYKWKRCRMRCRKRQEKRASKH